MARLSEIFDLQMGKTPARANNEYWENGTNRWVSIADLSGYEKYVEGTKEQITDKAVQESGIKTVPPGTVIMSFKLSLGKTAITQEPVYTNEAIMSFIPKNTYNISPDYFFYLLSSKDWSKGTNRAVMGATLNKATIADINVAIPSFEEQRKVVAILDKLSNLIFLRKQQLSKLDELIKSRFVEMFGDPIFNPLNWATRSLGDMCSIITGNTPSRKVAEYYGDYIEWIKSDNINTPQAILTVAEEGLSKKGLAVGRFVDSGSILMTCIAGSIGCIGNVAIANRKVAFNQQINGIIPNGNNVWFMYVQFELSKEVIQSSINMSLKGILSKGELSKMRFIFPPLELQNEYGRFAAQIDKSRLTIQQSLYKLEMLKKSLVQKFFG